MSRAKGEKRRFGIILQVIVFFVLAIMVSVRESSASVPDAVVSAAYHP